MSMKKIALFSILILVGAGCVDQVAPVTVEDVDTSGPDINLVVVEEAVPDEESEELTILDYYLSVPETVWPFFSLEDRETAIDVLDEENYYLSFSPLSLDGNGSIAVFLADDGTEYVVTELKGCGPLCQQDVFVFEVVDGEWIDRTAEVWVPLEPTEAQIESIRLVHLFDNPQNDPNDVPFAPLYEIPQFGTTVRAYDQWTGYVFGKLYWDGVSFTAEHLDTVVENIND